MREKYCATIVGGGDLARGRWGDLCRSLSGVETTDPGQTTVRPLCRRGRKFPGHWNCCLCKFGGGSPCGRRSAVGGRLLGSVPKPRSEMTNFVRASRRCHLFFRVKLPTETLDQIFGLLLCSTISGSRILLMLGVFAQSNCGMDDVPPSPVIS
jgi:hypothetical protein